MPKPFTDARHENSKSIAPGLVIEPHARSTARFVLLWVRDERAVKRCEARIADLGLVPRLVGLRRLGFRRSLDARDARRFPVYR